MRPRNAPNTRATRPRVDWRTLKSNHSMEGAAVTTVHQAVPTMIGDDIELAGRLYEAVGHHPALQGFTRELSIVTFRCVGVILRSFAPHAALSSAASAVVQQGGAGTLHQGLRSGRPHPGGALRLARELDLLLHGDGHRRGADAVAKRVRGERPVEDACHAIEGVLAVNPE